MRGEGAYLFSLFAAIIPLVLVWIALIGNNVAIYCFVCRLEERSSKYTFVSARHLPVTQSQPPSGGSYEDRFENDLAAHSSRAATIDASTGSSRNSGTNTMRPQNKETFAKTRQIAVQSFLYVFAYLMVFIFSFCVFILESTDPVGFESDKYFPLQVLAAMFFPLQGLFDAVIYLRPRYYRFRKHFPEKSWWFALQKAVWTRGTPAETEVALKKQYFSARATFAWYPDSEQVLRGQQQGGDH